MFEDMTFENIMEAMMEEMPDDIDTSEEAFCIMPVRNRRFSWKKHICLWPG